MAPVDLAELGRAVGRVQEEWEDPVGSGPWDGRGTHKGLMFLALLGKVKPAFSVASWLHPCPELASGQLAGQGRWGGKGTS